MESSPPPLNRRIDKAAQPFKPALEGIDALVGTKPALDYKSAGPGSFTPEHVAQIAAAKKASVKIRRACAVAKFSGVTTAVFATLTIIFSLNSIPGLMLGIG